MPELESKAALLPTPLKIERERRKLSAEEVAKAVGVSQPTINRIELGRKRPSPELALRLEAYFGEPLNRDKILFPEFYAQPRKKPSRADRLQEAS